jgi:hypothetical protein
MLQFHLQISYESVHVFYFGGRPIEIQLKKEKILYFLWDKLEKSDKYKSSTILYYDPQIKKIFIKKGVQVSFQPQSDFLGCIFSSQEP